MKLTELFDSIGWCITKSGNKTRVKKSFYLRNQHKYISPWFPKEINATEWINKYVFRRIPKSTMTLYEITRDVKVDFLTKQEGKIRNILYKAFEEKKIRQSDIAEHIESVLKLRGEKAREAFYDTLEKHDIEVIEDGLAQNESKFMGEIDACPKCGSDNLTSGLNIPGYDNSNIDDIKKLSKEKRRELIKRAKWYHECLACGHIMKLDMPNKLYEGEGYNYGELMVQMEDEKDDNRVKFHFNENGYTQEGDYKEEDKTIINLLNYYASIFGRNIEKIKGAVERSKHPVETKQRLLQKIEDIEKDDFVTEMSIVGGVAGFNANTYGPDVDTSDMRLPGKEKKRKIIRRKL